MAETSALSDSSSSSRLELKPEISPVTSSRVVSREDSSSRVSWIPASSPASLSAISVSTSEKFPWRLVISSWRPSRLEATSSRSSLRSVMFSRVAYCSLCRSMWLNRK
ncbi:hypothetical protein ES703_54194 [subsurface metagenome]